MFTTVLTDDPLSPASAEDQPALPAAGDTCRGERGARAGRLARLALLLPAVRARRPPHGLLPDGGRKG